MDENNKQPEVQDSNDVPEAQTVDTAALPAEEVESTEPVEQITDTAALPAQAAEPSVEVSEPVVPLEPIDADPALEPNEVPEPQPEQTIEPAAPEVPAMPDATQPEPAVPPVVAPAPKSALLSKKRIIIAATVVVAIVAAVVTWLLLTPKSSPAATEQNTETVQQQPRLGVAVTVADGVVEYQLADDPTGTWQPLTVVTELGEGDTVRTDVDGRAVLTLDDGSAVRLDADTLIELTSLVANDIKITQQTGAIYSRVVASDRTYSVVIDGDTTYQALGTAFVTLNKLGESGVQVYQSSVKAGEQTVAEGKQYYTVSSDANVQGKVTDIDLDKLTDDAFVAWNLAEDEKDANFKAKLGVLADVKQKSQAKADEAARLEQERKAQAELAARAKAERDKKAQEEADKKKKQSHNTSKEKVTRGTMSLTRSGETFSWSYTGQAVHGYKLVWSKSDSNPRFGSSEAIYFGDISQTSGSLLGKDKIGKGAFYVTVCAYTAGTEAEGCVDYSSVIKYTRN